MTSTTPRKMMTKSRMPAMTPAIFTVWSVCFSGSTASGFRVAAPGTGSPDNHCWNESLRSDDNTTNRHHVTHRHSAAGRERHKIYMMMCFLLVKQVSVSGHWITSESFMKIQMWAELLRLSSTNDWSSFIWTRGQRSERSSVYSVMWCMSSQTSISSAKWEEDEK